MTYSSRVAEHRNILKNIEASEKAKVKILPPLKPMIDTLNQFIEKEQAEQLTSFSDLKDKIGGSESQYYHACYAIAQTMLLEEDDKQRCVIFNGLSGSGKTVNQVREAVKNKKTRLINGLIPNGPKAQVGASINMIRNQNARTTESNITAKYVAVTHAYRKVEVQNSR